MRRNYYVYILTNYKNSVLYTGLTNNLKRRIYEHKQQIANGFTKRYNVTKLVYFELCSDIKGAIFREKQIKAGSRADKLKLVNASNEKWEDLYFNL